MICVVVRIASNRHDASGHRAEQHAILPAIVQNGVLASAEIEVRRGRNRDFPEHLMGGQVNRDDEFPRVEEEMVRGDDHDRIGRRPANRHAGDGVHTFRVMQKGRDVQLLKDTAVLRGEADDFSPTATVERVTHVVVPEPAPGVHGERKPCDVCIVTFPSQRPVRIDRVDARVPLGAIKGSIVTVERIKIDRVVNEGRARLSLPEVRVIPCDLEDVRLIGCVRIYVNGVQPA